MKKIKHITQSKPNSCISATLAMLLGHDDDSQVWSEFGEGYIKSSETHNYASYLHTKGVKVDCGYPAHISHCIQLGEVYLLTVPSLNIQGGFHSIIWDARGHDDNMICYDPCRGREGRKFYVWDEEVENGVPLNGYVIDFRIVSDGTASHD